MFYTLWKRLLVLVRRDRFESELQDEMGFHVEMKIQENVEAGMRPEEARYAALREFGNRTTMQEESTEVWVFGFLEKLAQDLRYGFRMLRRSPGFTAVAVLSLGIGIGANTAIFSLIDAVMLRMLPVEKPGELVQLDWGTAGQTTSLFTYPMFEQIRDYSPVFAGVFAWERTKFYVRQGETAERVEGLSVSGDYYSTLGVPAVAGRTIRVDDDRPDSAPVAVISHQYWRRTFSSDPGAVGRTISVEGVPCMIIGVISPEFSGTDVGWAPAVVVPLSLQPQLRPSLRRLQSRDTIWLRIMGRRRPDVSLAQVQAGLEALWPSMLAQVMPTHHPVQAQRDFLSKKIFVSPGSSGFSDLRQKFSSPLFVLMGTVGLILLIACANIANLLLARATARQKELAVRLAVGAGRWRLVRQLLTESALLAFIGALLGLILAFAGSRLLVRMLSTRLVPVTLELRPDVRILAFAGIVALLTAVLFGLVPALRATRSGPGSALRERGRGLHGGLTQWGLGKMLVAAQMALSLPLLVGAGLFVRSLANLTSMDAGFDRKGVLLVSLDSERTGYKGARLADFYQQLVERVGTLSGVLSASLSSRTPVSGDYWNSMLSVEGYIPRPGENMYVYFNSVGLRFFETLGTPLILGRDFGTQDNENSRKVAIINESIARSYFPSVNPIGRRISAQQDPDRRDMEIVGVVKDAKYDNLRELRSHTVYVPYRQHLKRLRGITISVRTENQVSDTVARAIRQEADVPVTFRTMTEQVDQWLVQERLITTLSSFFGLLALLLSSIGLYGLMAYTVARRTGEIGIRMALGAQRGNVLWLVMREIVFLLTLGIIVGIPGALGTARFVSSMLFGLMPTDPWTLAGATVLLAAVGLLAGYLPARRASRVDPMVALRYE